MVSIIFEIEMFKRQYKDYPNFTIPKNLSKKSLERLKKIIDDRLNKVKKRLV